MNNKYSVACITLIRDKYTLQFVRRCYSLRGIYGRFDSNAKNDSQLPSVSIISVPQQIDHVVRKMCCCSRAVTTFDFV